MAKLPAFQFYPGDWLKDPALRRCSPAARGVWMDMICLMFECEERGVLATGGAPWSDQEIAEAITGPTDVVLMCVRELMEKKVAHRNSTGAIFSKRLVRDEQIRRTTRDRVARHRSGEISEAKTHPPQRNEGSWQGASSQKHAGGDARATQAKATATAGGRATAKATTQVADPSPALRDQDDKASLVGQQDDKTPGAWSQNDKAVSGNETEGVTELVTEDVTPRYEDEVEDEKEDEDEVEVEKEVEDEFENKVEFEKKLKLSSEEIYAEYPRKEARRVALEAIANAHRRLMGGEAGDPLSAREAAHLLLEKTREYARSPRGRAGANPPNGPATPHPATWFNQARYLDDTKTWWDGPRHAVNAGDARRLAEARVGMHPDPGEQQQNQKQKPLEPDELDWLAKKPDQEVEKYIGKIPEWWEQVRARRAALSAEYRVPS